MLRVAECRHPRLRRSDQEGECHQCREERQHCARQSQPLRQWIRKYQQTNDPLDRAKSARERVSVVRGLPCTLSWYELPLMGQMRFVLLRMFVKERHYRTVGDERGNAVRLVRGEFEKADPEKDHGDGNPHEIRTQFLCTHEYIEHVVRCTVH